MLKGYELAQSLSLLLNEFYVGYSFNELHFLSIMEKCMRQFSKTAEIITLSADRSFDILPNQFVNSIFALVLCRSTIFIVLDICLHFCTNELHKTRNPSI